MPTPISYVGSHLISVHSNGMLIRVADTVTEIDEELCETALGGCVVTEN